jgi:catechol 2,3-dioxygenase-like lactoylglutathione lyase family enzyme
MTGRAYRVEVVASVSVCYIVGDVAAAIAFNCGQLDFHQVMHPAPTFAMLDRGELRLVLNAPSSQGGGEHAMPDGTKPEPGEWNRFVIEVADIADPVQLLRQDGVHSRNEIVEGVGGKQILLEDPAGNPIELFKPSIPEAGLADA